MSAPTDPSADFKPFVPPTEAPKEFTISAVVTGTLLGLVFAASSLYLVLKVGMTVSASIPVAVLAITLFRAFGKATILENNIVQTAGSAGESIAFGVGVTMPALLTLGFGMEIGRVMIVSVLGGILGILAMIPLRRAFIVKMHGRPGQPGTLLYPEGTACAQVLISGEKGGTTGKTVFIGFGLAFLHKFVTEGMSLLKGTLTYPVAFINKAAEVSCEMATELLGVGYIIGVRTSSMMMGGAVLGYLVILPVIYLIGENNPNPVPPGKKPIAEMSVKDIRNNYLLFIGAGCVATAGILSMLKTLPMIVRGLRASLGGVGAGPGGEVQRTDRDLPLAVVLVGSLALIGVLALFLMAEVGVQSALLGALLVVLFGFLFVTVSARLTGEIGSSSNPISGMTTATLMLTCLIFLALGLTSSTDRVIALSIAAVVCIASSNGGTVAQSLKTGYLVGGTPILMQYAILIGTLVSAVVIGGILIYGLNGPGTVHSRKPENLLKVTLTPAEIGRLKQTETFEGTQYLVFDTRNDDVTGETAEYQPRPELLAVKKDLPGRYLVNRDTGKVEVFRDDAIMGRLEQRDDGTPVRRQFEAPKTRVLGIVINGVLKGELNWSMIGIGAMIALTMELCGVSALAFAVGLYVPIQYSTPIFLGGVVRALIDRKLAKQAAAELASAGSDPEARARAEVEALRRSETSPGVLLASGYIAGGSLAGVAVAFLMFSEYLPRDLTSWQYAKVAVGQPQSLPDAANAIARRELGDKATEKQVKEYAAEVVGINEEELPFIWVKVPGNTEVKLPENQTHTTTAETTLGEVAKATLGRDWKAAKLFDLNKDKLKLPEKLPAEAQVALPQSWVPAAIAFLGLIVVLWAVGSGYVLKG